MISIDCKHSAAQVQIQRAKASLTSVPQIDFCSKLLQALLWPITLTAMSKSQVWCGSVMIPVAGLVTWWEYGTFNGSENFVS